MRICTVLYYRPGILVRSFALFNFGMVKGKLSDILSSKWLHREQRIASTLFFFFFNNRINMATLIVTKETRSPA